MFTSGSTSPPGTRRRGSPWALLLAALLAASACGTAGPAGAEATTTLDASQPFGGDPTNEGTPVAGGTLRVGMYTEARSFDPTIGSNLIASAVYDSLLKMDAAGEPQPFLAASMTTPDDGTTWRMGLRPGVTFHDGTPLDAEAVLFNVARQRDDPTALGHLYTEPIEAMRAVDPFTVEFTLKRPTGSFPVAFALPFSSGNLGTIASPTVMYNQFHTGGINNYGDYSNPEVDAALDEAASTTDPARRTAAYQRAQVLLNQDIAVVWLARAAKAAIAQPHVKGVSRYLSSELFWADTWIAR